MQKTKLSASFAPQKEIGASTFGSRINGEVWIKPIA
jgi:hypothetical protein